MALLFGNRRRTIGPYWMRVLSSLVGMPSAQQNFIIVLSTLLLAAFIFTGWLLVRQSDEGDMLSNGKWLMRQGKSAWAVSQFESLVRKYPRNFEAYVQLGNAYAEVGQIGKAKNAYQTAANKSKYNRIEASVALSLLLITEKKYEEAERKLIEVYNAEPRKEKNTRLLNAFASLYDQWGNELLNKPEPDLQLAYIKIYRALLFVQDAGMKSNLVDKLLRTGDSLVNQYLNQLAFDKAVIVLKRNLRFDPENRDLLFNLVTVYEKQGDLDAAVYWAQRGTDSQLLKEKLAILLEEQKKGVTNKTATKTADAKAGDKKPAEDKKLNASARFGLKKTSTSRKRRRARRVAPVQKVVPAAPAPLPAETTTAPQPEAPVNP